MRYLGTFHRPKHELPENFQNCKRYQKRPLGQLSLLWEKIKHRSSLLSSTL
jgi:hypothetical protein